MITRLAAMLLIVLSFQGFSQSLEEGSTDGSPGQVNTIDSLTNAISQSIQPAQDKYDSLIQTTDQSIAALQHTIDSLNRLGEPADFLSHRMDSLRQWKQQKLEEVKAFRQLDSLQSSFDQTIYALKSRYDSIAQKAENSIHNIRERIDSLSNVNLPTDKLMSRIDSIQQWKDENINKLNQKVTDIKSKTIAKLDSLGLPDEMTSKLNELTSVVDKVDLKMPVAELPKLDLPGTDISLGVPGLSDGLNTSLPGVDLPTQDIASNVPGLDNAIPGADIPSLGADGVGADIKQYQDQVNGVVPTNAEEVSTMVEEKAMQVDQVGDVQGQLGEVDKLKGMTGNLQDQEAMKEQMKEAAKKEAVNHFAGQEEKLRAAMEKISKYKQKYSSVQSLADLPKKRPNEMRGKPLVERLLPGIALQVHRNNDWLLDINPYVGYRFNSRLTAGAGWNYRLAFNPDSRSFNTASRIYGIRTYGEFKIGKGFSGRLEAEYMNTWVPPTFASKRNDANGREWVFTTMAGLKKEYRFIKNVKGTVFILYNLYDPHYRSPYGDKLNMRFGFEFPQKKKQKSR